MHRRIRTAPLLAIRGELNDLGVRTWLPTPHAVRACGDKAVFHTVMTTRRIPTPQTWLPEQLAQVPDGCELVVKPRHGHGAKNLHACRTRHQAQIMCELVPEALVQQRLTGTEFTADCLVDHDGRASVVLRHRLRVRNGLAVVARTFHDEEVTDLVT